MPEDLTTSPLGRLFKIGGVATRIGVSLALNQALGLMRDGPLRQAQRNEKFVLNAMRATEALGELKGAAMKVGQMLSVHDGMLPEEVMAVLRTLQKEAPQVSFATMQNTLQQEIPDFETRFTHLDTDAIAAASIGQVYRGRLSDGREVAVKVQYPDIDKVVRADLKNLKKLFGSVVAMVSDFEFEPIWDELKERLLEELDYTVEAANIKRMVALHADVPDVVIPNVVEAASTRRVLTMDYVPGLSPDAACSKHYPPELHNAWGTTLLTFTLRGLLKHRFLHADPNFANFGFLEDGRVIVYDHGCMKTIEPDLAHGYVRLLRALLDDKPNQLPALLQEIGVAVRSTNKPIRQELLDPMLQLATRVFAHEPYRFGSDTEIYDFMLETKMRDLEEYHDTTFPPDMTFVHRALGGLFGNLCRLEATATWREPIGELCEPLC